MENISRMLHLENMDKKRTARGAFNKSSNAPKHAGRMITANDLLKGKVKRQYRGTGKVVRYNMYDENGIMSLEEFKGLPLEKQVVVMLEYREKYPVKDILGNWNMTNYDYYNMLNELGIDTQRKQRRKSVPIKTEKKAVPESSPAPTKPDGLVIQTDISEITPKKNGMHFFFNSDSADAELISKKLEKAGLLLEDEEGKFAIKLSIIEVEDNKS